MSLTHLLPGHAALEDRLDVLVVWNVRLSDKVGVVFDVYGHIVAVFCCCYGGTVVCALVLLRSIQLCERRFVVLVGCVWSVGRQRGLEGSRIFIVARSVGKNCVAKGALTWEGRYIYIVKPFVLSFESCVLC